MNDYRRPIPQQPRPDWAAIRRTPIQECGEPLIPASLLPDRILARPAYFHQGLEAALPECYVRESVFDRLVDAACRLPSGHRLVLFDGWRPRRLQELLFRRCSAEFRASDTHLSETQANALAEDFVARPSEDPSSPPFHNTGGAVDVSVVDPHGHLLDMGSQFDANIPESHTHHLENAGQAEPARTNRRLLYHAMLAAGFLNLATEWWHFDYGDQLWAWYRGEGTVARYGACQAPFRWA